MTFNRALRWWPPLGFVATLVLGWVVGEGPSPFDNWFTRVVGAVVIPHLNWFLAVTNWRLGGPVFVICVAITLYRRQWRLAALMTACPVAAIAITEVLKRLFERHKGGALAYPSGHVTLLVAVMGVFVVVAGARMWAVTMAVVVSLVGIAGQACSYHYLTDTVGATMLSTAVVCVAVRLATPAPANRGSPLLDAA